jgi:hypothetical protein
VQHAAGAIVFTALAVKKFAPLLDTMDSPSTPSGIGIWARSSSVGMMSCSPTSRESTWLDRTRGSPAAPTKIMGMALDPS